MFEMQTLTCKMGHEYEALVYRTGRRRQWCDDHRKEYTRQRAQAYRERHPDRFRANVRRAQIKAFYGLTEDGYDAMLSAQGGVCAICKRAEEGRVLCVDHDHACCPGARSCGECVRGLLCDRCNRGLGFFRDDAAALAAAGEYLTHANCD